LTSKRGGALALRASSSLKTCAAGSWIGSTERSSPPSAFGDHGFLLRAGNGHQQGRQHETGAQDFRRHQADSMNWLRPGNGAHSLSPRLAARERISRKPAANQFSTWS
jgi:hypothetical protein